jgi:hypothetical protein
MTREQRDAAINWLSHNLTLSLQQIQAKFQISPATATRYKAMARSLRAQRKEQIKLERLAAKNAASLSTPPEPAPAVDTELNAGTNVSAILEERGKRYGEFITHAKITQRLKAVAHAFAAEQGKTFDADQAEAIDMIFHKLGRILNGDPNYADSWVDIAGYAKLVADRLEQKNG